MATHSSTLAWKIPRAEETSGPQSMGLQRVGHNWVTEHTNSIIFRSVLIQRQRTFFPINMMTSNGKLNFSIKKIRIQINMKVYL